VWLVHGETAAAQGLCEALRAEAVRAEVARPGGTVDLGAPA
jgi:hypothetical protein